MAQTQITRKYPGRKADEIYSAVDAVMGRLAKELSLDYRTDGSGRTGTVSRMGISGTYLVRDGEVVVDLAFPMLVPGTLKKRVQADVERRLDGLFA